MTLGGALLGVVDPEIISKLRERGERRAFAAGEVLMHQGDASPSIFLVVEGRVRVERSVPHVARPLHVADLGPGEVVGEIGVLNAAARSATVRAITDAVLIELSRQQTLEALVELPGLPVVHRRLIEKRLSENAILEERLARYVDRRPDPARILSM